MVQHPVIQFGALILAAYQVTCTLVFLGLFTRPSTSLSAASWLFKLWSLAAFIIGFGFQMWCMSFFLQERDRLDVLNRMLTFTFLGLLLPIHAAFGLFATFNPAAWQRIPALRERLRQARLNRVRRFFHEPPAA